MRRVVSAALLAAGLVAAGPGEAQAEKTYRVVISSQPQGAKVYFGDNEGRPAGETPYDCRLPTGDHTIFLELEDHEPIIDQIHVEARRKPQLFKFEFVEIIYAHLKVTAAEGDDAAKGAAIVIDGEWAGTVPETLRVRAGAHQVVVDQKGYARFEKWIELVEGEHSELTVSLKRPAKPGSDKPPPPKPTRVQPYVVAGASLEMGWRNWAYENPLTESARPFQASFVPMFRIDAELFPMASKKSAIRGASLHFNSAFGMPPDAATTSGGTIDTAWNEVEGGFRFTYAANPKRGAAFGAGISIGRLAFEFGNAGALTGETPDVDYRYVRYGAHGGYLTGRHRVFGGFGYLRVSSAGEMAERFRSASASGLDLHIGYSWRLLSRLHLRGIFTYRGIGLDLESETGDLIEADGGSDKYYNLQVGATYSY